MFLRCRRRWSQRWVAGAADTIQLTASTKKMPAVSRPRPSSPSETCSKPPTKESRHAANRSAMRMPIAVSDPRSQFASPRRPFGFVKSGPYGWSLKNGSGQYLARGSVCQLVQHADARRGTRQKPLRLRSHLSHVRTSLHRGNGGAQSQ